MASQVGGVRFVQFVVPHPLVDLMLGCVDTTLRAGHQEDADPKLIDAVVNLRDFLTDVKERPQAYPVTGKMATSLKKRARRSPSLPQNSNGAWPRGWGT